VGTKPRDMLWQGALHRKLLLFRVSWFIFHSSRRFNDIRFYSSFVRQTIYATTSTLERSYRLGSSRHPKFSTLHKLSEIADADLVRRERFVLQGFLNTLEKFPFKNERDINLLKEVIGRLDGLFLLVVVGEFNSGKSSLINALLGGPFLPYGPTPTTAQVSLIKDTSSVSSSSTMDPDTAANPYYQIYSVPVPWLKYMTIVDTPGTNAIEQAHELVTKEFVPRADLVLFTTSADRPFSESERKFLEEIRGWGKKIVIVLNKIDLLLTDNNNNQPSPNEQEDSIQAVVHYVRDHARVLVGSDPQIFPVSARLALLGKEKQSSALMEASRLSRLESFITETLDDRERWKIKLETPLALAQSLHRTYASHVQRRSQVLDKDLACLSDIQESLEMYRKDFDYESHLARIDNILLRLQQRASQYFYQRIQLRHSIPLWRNHPSLSPEEEISSVLGNTEEELEQEVVAMVGWLQEKNRRHWKEISRLLDHRLHSRQRELEDKMTTTSPRNTNHALEDLSLVASTPAMDDWDMDFESKRQMMLTELKRVSTDWWRAKFSAREEAQHLVAHIRKSLLVLWSAQVGALGLLGTLSMLSTLDISGILVTAAVSIASTGVFPYRKKQFLRSFQSKMDQFRGALREELEKELRHQLDQHILSMENALAPFSRFVRSRKAMVEEEQQQLNHIASQIGMMRDLVSKRMEPATTTTTTTSNSNSSNNHGTTNTAEPVASTKEYPLNK